MLPVLLYLSIAKFRLGCFSYFTSVPGFLHVSLLLYVAFHPTNNLNTCKYKYRNAIITQIENKYASTPTQMKPKLGSPDEWETKKPEFHHLHKNTRTLAQRNRKGEREKVFRNGMNWIYRIKITGEVRVGAHSIHSLFSLSLSLAGK